MKLLSIYFYQQVRNPLLNRKLGTDADSLPLSPIILSGFPAFQGAETIPPASSGTAGLAAPPIVVTEATEVGDMDSNDVSKNGPLQAPIPSLTLTGIPTLTIALAPEDLAPILAPAAPPLGNPSVSPEPSMTGTTVTPPPVPVLAPAAPPLENPSVVPEPRTTGTAATPPPVPVLAPAAPPLGNPSVVPEPSMAGATATAPPGPVLVPVAPPQENHLVVPEPSMATTAPAPILAPAAPPQEDTSAAPSVGEIGENEQRAIKRGKMRPNASLTARYGTHIVPSLLHPHYASYTV